MEKSLTTFLSQFAGELSIIERFKEVEIKIKSTSHKSITEQGFTDSLGFLNSRDKLQLSVKIEALESIDFYSQASNSDFFTELASSTATFSNITYIISIFKGFSLGILSLYNKDEFIKYLKGLPIESQLHQFNDIIKNHGSLVFEYQTLDLEFHTSSIRFDNSVQNVEIIDRSSVIDKSKGGCNYNHISDFMLIPEDFDLSVKAGNDFDAIFSNLKSILSRIFLYDISNLTQNKLVYKLNGYKSLQGDLDLTNLGPDTDDQHFRIYSWVYNSGNYNDKLGLARNIISLHIADTSTMNVAGDPFQAIQSSYKVYEKQNIKQYIEIRNKVTDQLLSFHDRANKIIETFASGFQKSALALLTFYITVFALKFLNKDDLTNIFTWDASILSTAFVTFTGAYFFAARWEVRVQQKRFHDNYFNLKKRYEDLLDTQDIERILNNDREFEEDIAFMEEKRKIYSRLWVGFLILLLCVTWFLFFGNKLAVFFKVVMVLLLKLQFYIFH
jgi:hypothetical protein